MKHDNDVYVSIHNMIMPDNICHKCEKKFANRQYLNKHMKRCLKDKKKFICHKCGTQFANMGNLKRHKERYCYNNNIMKETIKKNQQSETCSAKINTQSVQPNVSEQQNNNVTDPLIIELLVNQQKQIENLQKQIEDEKSYRAKIDDILIKIIEKPSTQNIINNTLVINNYFNSSLDLYDLTVKLKGLEFAQIRGTPPLTPFLLLCFDLLQGVNGVSPYFEPIMKFLIEPDVEHSPIRLNADGLIELHRSETLVEVDEVGSKLEKNTKKVVSDAYLKAFNNTGGHPHTPLIISLCQITIK